MGRDYMGRAVPLLEQLEADSNGVRGEATFVLPFRSGAFGPIQNMPAPLRGGVDIEFKFRSPLHDSIDQMKGQIFLPTKQMITEAIALDQTAPDILDAKIALRDVLQGIQTPARWTRTPEQIDSMDMQREDAAKTQAFIAAAHGCANVAKTISESQKNVAKAAPGGVAAPVI